MILCIKKGIDKIEIRPLEVPYYRKICLAMKDRKRLTPAALKFMEYLSKSSLFD